MKHEEQREEGHLDTISISRQCEHFSVDIIVTGDMDADLQNTVINRVARALVLVMEGRDPRREGLGELVTSMTLESPTPETIREAVEKLAQEAMEHMEHMEKHQGEGADGD